MMNKILLTLLFCLTLTQASFAQVAVIAHKDVPVDSIKHSELLNFYVLDIKAWSNGTPVVVFDLKPKDSVKEDFYDFLGKSTSRMKSIWMKKLLSGEGNPPEALKSEEEMLQKVATTIGAIGFVSKDSIDEKIKVLLVTTKNGKN